MKFLAIILFALSAFTAFTEEKKYGSFILNTEIPNTLFFVDEIKANDSFELRKALRNHDIQNIVLASPGGSVWEGLQMAGIIFDNRLRTYVPSGATCASACSYLFLAGKERLVDGRLGVHQAYSSNYKEKKAVGETQYVTQFTVSEIIGFLNSFGTPAFVYERMFEDIDMYFFDASELTKLNSEDFDLADASKSSLAKFMRTKIRSKALVKISQTSNDEDELSDRKKLIKISQENLNRLGCNAGYADGVIGKRTLRALARYSNVIGQNFQRKDLFDIKFIEQIKSSQKACPKAQQKTYAKNTFFGYPYWDGNCLKRTNIFGFTENHCPVSNNSNPAIFVEVTSNCPGKLGNWKLKNGLGVHSTTRGDLKVCWYEK